MDCIPGVAHFGALNVSDRLVLCDVLPPINDNGLARHGVNAAIPRVEIVGKLDLWRKLGAIDAISFGMSLSRDRRHFDSNRRPPATHETDAAIVTRAAPECRNFPPRTEYANAGSAPSTDIAT